ncbi:MAG: metal ABC transporter ATP-binding protein [Candidatus Acetothermia bacterium]|jgi:manganese/iron transport system ATP-binding protein|nr:metal ABC transporter ATP-binding protein [Candidatus Acetothermia bacterium]MDH7506097.1 metal ABC transporter ATP-binding protein [Candidatus Acetothermia bacterium]
MELFRRCSPHEPCTPLLEAEAITVRYNGHLALEGVSFKLEESEQLALIGPNGAGKSTLFKVIAGVLRPSGGRVSVCGRGPGEHICIAYLPQRSQVEWGFPLTVADVVLMGRVGRLGPLRLPGPRDRERVRESLEVVGLADLANRPIGELSGGQQQRMFIARALAQEAQLMLLDEPLTGLDLPAQEEILRILGELRQRGVAVMLATHDLGLAAERFEQMILLNRRIIAMGSPGEVLTPARLQEAYGRQLRLIESSEGLLALSDACCDRGG